MAPIRPMHPRPQLTREGWRSLDGTWEFAYDDAGVFSAPTQVFFDRQIEVPFCPESEASGLGHTTYHKAVWYRRTLTLEPHELGGHLLLHFGAVDYHARVWVDGALLAQHEGGHTPFRADLTERARAAHALGRTTLEIVVQAQDDPHDLGIPRGKQDWLEQAHDIWYPRTTGIWQTVWLEALPETRVEALRWTSHLERWELGLELRLSGELRPGMTVRVRLEHHGEELAEDTYKVLSHEVYRRLSLSDPGIDSGRIELLWSPGHPHIIEASIELLEGDIVLDRVGSYTALRSVGVQDGRFLLNGRPYQLRMVLDQGYWPDTLMTPPSGEALRRDVELTKQLGFNGARKHQKIEDPRYLYWCDHLGLLVWEEMPSAYRYTPETAGRLMREWLEVLERDASHPCVVAWVPFNESWGVPDLPRNPAHRHLVRGFYHTTKALDPSRPCIGNDGWEQNASDLLTIHDYEQDAEELLERYGTLTALHRSLLEVQPGNRVIAFSELEARGLPAMLSEFGGSAFSLEQEVRGWGYHRAGDAESFAAQYSALLEAVHECWPALIGFCYTQLTDTFQEKNGLLTADRQPKAPLALLAEATRGEKSEWELDNDPTPDPYGYSREWRAKQRRLALRAPLEQS